MKLFDIFHLLVLSRVPNLSVHPFGQVSDFPKCLLCKVKVRKGVKCSTLNSTFSSGTFSKSSAVSFSSDPSCLLPGAMKDLHPLAWWLMLTENWRFVSLLFCSIIMCLKYTKSHCLCTVNVVSSNGCLKLSVLELYFVSYGLDGR